MKKLFPLAILFFISIIVFAQDSASDDNNFKPKKGNVGTTLNLTGLIDDIQLETTNSQLGQNILFVRYYLEDDLVLRLGLGADFNNYRQIVADSVLNTLAEGDSVNSQFILNISGGIEKHFNSSKRLDPYVFGQMNLTFVGKETTEIDVTVTAPNGTGNSKQTIKRDGGIGFGLLLGGGFNYFLAKNFSVGSEVGLLLNYSSIGGVTSNNTTINPINGNPSSEFISSEDQVNEFEMGVQASALINFSYFF